MGQPRSKLHEFWRTLWRRFFTMPGVQWIAAVLMFVGIWFVYLTCRVRYINKSTFEHFVGRPVIFAFWHGRSMMLSPITKKFGFHGYAISSMHRDGRLMAKLQMLFGLHPIYGSTGRRGAVGALREGVRQLQAGHLVCLSPDGPKGPRMRAHDGVLYFAKMTGAPIVPVCFSSNRAWFQKRWDRYLIATPFSRISIAAGEPFYVPRDADIETTRAELEKIMIAQLQEMDAGFGLEKIEAGENKA